MTGSVPPTALIEDGRATVTGDPSLLQRLAGMLVHFERDRLRDDAGRREARLSEPMEDFQVEPLGDTSGG